jgi:cell division septation protein DedD
MQFASGLSKTASQHVVDQLKKGGYDAYVMETEVKGKVWYRVRVGFFPSREEARRVAREITRSYGLQSPWLARQPQE